MSRPYIRSLRLLAPARSGGARPSHSSVPVSRADFYREELLKHQRCLRAQREYFSANAIDKVEAALTDTIANLDHICKRCDCDHVVSCLLRQFDTVTRLSSWTDPKTHH